MASTSGRHEVRLRGEQRAAIACFPVLSGVFTASMLGTSRPPCMQAPVTAGRIERLKQLLNRKLSDDFVSTLRDGELEWLVAKGFNSVEAFQAATVSALHGLAPGRAGALCAAFTGEAAGRVCSKSDATTWALGWGG